MWRSLLSAAVVFWAVAIVAHDSRAQLVWNQKMEQHSAILPLTLDNDVYRIRAKPPVGIKPFDIHCDIGITDTVLTDQRGTSAGESGQKVASSLLSRDNLDVHFTDRVFTGHHTLPGDRIIEKYDFDCGINIKYQNKKNVAQVEIRLGYILPSGDIEGLTWAKLRRKQRQYTQNLARCARCKADIAGLQNEYRALSTSGGNEVQQSRAQARMSGINRQIDRLSRFASREGEFQRDLAAFVSLDEYLKTKVNGCQVFVHFHHDGKTLPVDIDELKRNRVRPIQVFEVSKDPILSSESPES